MTTTNIEAKIVNMSFVCACLVVAIHTDFSLLPSVGAGNCNICAVHRVFNLDHRGLAAVFPALDIRSFRRAMKCGL